MASEQGRYTVIRKLARARSLSVFLLLGSLALVPAVALIDSESQMDFSPTTGSGSTSEAAESKVDAPVDAGMARDVSGFASL